MYLTVSSNQYTRHRKLRILILTITKYYYYQTETELESVKTLLNDALLVSIYVLLTESSFTHLSKTVAVINKVVIIKTVVYE